MKVSWPFGVALRREASSRLMLRWLKTVVVSDEEKAHWMRQAGTGKASASESLLTCRNPKTTSEPGCFGYSGMSLADIRLLARWCPACRRREPGLRLPHGTGEGASRYWPVPFRAVRQGGPQAAEPRGAEYRRGARWRTGS